jgi:alkylation response protein AidB-like acyl-CoA dehydrogenase
MEVLGRSRVLRELPIQKFARDAMCLQHMGGTQQINRIKIGAILESRVKEGRLSR